MLKVATAVAAATTPPATATPRPPFASSSRAAPPATYTSTRCASWIVAGRSGDHSHDAAVHAHRAARPATVMSAARGTRSSRAPARIATTTAA